MKMLTRGQLRVQMELPDKDDLLHNVSRAADRLTMSIVIAGLFIGSSVVYYARIQPVIFGIPVIGFLGYLIALGLGLWIVGSIIREDRQHKRRRR
jgi:ubiquinone biosynthesis protein